MKEKYSGDPKSDHSKSKIIPNPEIFDFQFQTVKSPVVAYNCFSRQVVRQNDTDLTSLCMQFEKVGRRLLLEDFRREGECFVS